MRRAGAAVRDARAMRHPPISHRRAALALRTLAVVLLAATALGLVLVQRWGATYRDGLDITVEGAAVTGDSARTVADLSDDVVALGDTLSQGMRDGAETVELAAGTSASLAETARTNLADGAEGTALVADRTADVVETIERFIPGDDEESLAEELRSIADGLEPAPDQLRALGDDLEASGEALADTASSLDRAADQLGELAAGLDRSQQQLDDIDSFAADVGDRASAARDRLALDQWLLRILLVLVGLASAAAAWLGARLVDDAARHAVA